MHHRIAADTAYVLNDLEPILRRHPTLVAADEPIPRTPSCWSWGWTR